MAWLVGDRRLRVRYERRADILLGSCSWPARSSAATGWTAQAPRRAVGAGGRGSVPISRRP